MSAVLVPVGTVRNMELVFSKVLLVGDTHGNPQWWAQVVAPVADRLGVDAVVQLGDFGYWPDGTEFFTAVAATPVPVWFLDGNHEHHDHLDAVAAAARARRGIELETAPVPLGVNLGFLPRGARFAIVDRESTITVVAVGGAHSIDRSQRQLGRDYFLQERLDDRDIAAASSGGTADVLLCHDAPAGWQIPGLLRDADLPLAWALERPGCEEHRARLREVYESLAPRSVVHGHYHSAYAIDVEELWGTVSVDGLDCDGGDHSLATLENRRGEAVIGRVQWR